MLTKSNVLVLDEATASMDIKTDELIQKIIRTEFKNSTTLTIAHRINTILDSDRILSKFYFMWNHKFMKYSALDKGKIAEYDAPQALIKKGGIFASLVEESKQAWNIPKTYCPNGTWISKIKMNSELFSIHMKCEEINAYKNIANNTIKNVFK